MSHFSLKYIYIFFYNLLDTVDFFNNSISILGPPGPPGHSPQGPQGSRGAPGAPGTIFL